jgi:hypothetical protein
MWIMGKCGAYSIVRKGAVGEVQVRAREKRDLQNLLLLVALPADRLIVTKAGDYGFRVIVNAEELERIFTVLMDSIDYSNFKSAVARRPDQSRKVSVYHQIWHLLAELQPWPPYSGGVSDGRRQDRFVSDPEPSRERSLDDHLDALSQNSLETKPSHPTNKKHKGKGSQSSLDL